MVGSHPKKWRLMTLAGASVLIALAIIVMLWEWPMQAAENATLQMLKQKVAQQAVTTLLNNQLPLKLDGTAVLPTTPTLPGGPFRPLPLHLSTAGLNRPLPPGDYVIKAMAFCSEYSVHRPGAGVAYEIAPMQGKAAKAIAALLWRGTVEKGRSPHDLQAVSWAIQSGLPYAKMPRNYQSIIDDVIPDQRHQLNADFFQELEDLYQSHAKSAGLPPLERFLAGLGKSGELALSADRQRKALLRQSTNDQIRDQVLFAGQESRTALVKAEEGPWTVMIPDIAYVRYRVVGGNMAANNEIQIRILAPKQSLARNFMPEPALLASFRDEETPRVLRVQAAAAAGPSVAGLTGGGIGYSVSRAAQALAFVPTPAPGANPPLDDSSGSVGKLNDLKGTATLTHNGETKPLSPGDHIHMGDTVETAAGTTLHITFADDTTLALSGNTKLTIDDYVYDPAGSTGTAHYSVLSGAFQYVSGLTAKEKDPDIQVNTPVGCICIRGTEYIARYDPKTGSMEVALIEGAVMIKPKRNTVETPITAPTKIVFTLYGVKTSPLTREEYDTLRELLGLQPPRYIF